MKYSNVKNCLLPQCSILFDYNFTERTDILHLDKYNGSLSLIGKVDREKSSHFDVKVLASSECNNTFFRNCSGDHDSVLSIKLNVKDIDDNPPQFISKIFSRSITFDKQVNTEVINLKDKVYDLDGAPYNNSQYRLLKLLPSQGMEKSFKNKEEPFVVQPSGPILTNMLFQADLVGYFLLKVEVYEKYNERYNDTADIKIYIVSNEQRVRLVFSDLPSEVESFIDDLAEKLSDFLDLNITVGAIKTHTKDNGYRDTKKTDAFIYASEIESEGFLSASDLQKKLDFNSDARNLLFNYGVEEAQGLSLKEDEDGDETLRRLFIILVTAMSIAVVAFVLILLKVVHMFRRRLKAATTMAYVSSKTQEMYEHPGTNKYYTAENPLYGKNIKAPELEEDRNSTNSLDLNEVDYNSKPKMPDNPEEEQEIVLQIMGSGVASPQHNHYTNHNARLSKVLEEYDSSVNNNKPSPVLINGVGMNHSSGQVKANGIPGLGQDVQEAVTRFSDGSLSKSSTFPETPSEHGNLEYTEI